MGCVLNYFNDESQSIGQSLYPSSQMSTYLSNQSSYPILNQSSIYPTINQSINLSSSGKYDLSYSGNILAAGDLIMTYYVLKTENFSFKSYSEANTRFEKPGQ